MPVDGAVSTFTESSSRLESPRKTDLSHERSEIRVSRELIRKIISWTVNDSSVKARTEAVHQAPIPRKKRINPGRISSVTKNRIPRRNQIRTGETDSISTPYNKD
jgi:hypothetical protein